MGTTFQISLKGKLVAHKGSPNASGVFWTAADYPPDDVLTEAQHLGAILKKQSALRELFANEGRTLEIQGWAASPQPLKCNPRLISINFPDALWFEYCDWEATFEADTVWGISQEGTTPGQGYFLSSASEEWTLDPTSDASAGEDPTYRLTHRISAVGKRHYNEAGSLLTEAWQQASGWVLPRLGLADYAYSMFAPGGHGAGENFGAFDYSRAQAVNKLGGSYQVTETWTVSSGSLAHEDYQVQSRVTDQEGGSTEISIEGTIKGFDKRTASPPHSLLSDKWTNARAKWEEVEPLLLSRAEELSELDVYDQPSSRTVTYSKTAGTVGYSYVYSDRYDPLMDSEALSESISVQDQHAANVFASIGVLSRPAGPVLQDIGSSTAKERTISIAIRKPKRRKDYAPAKPSGIASFIIARYPEGYTQLFVRQDSESFDELEGSYSRTVSLVWQ